MTTTGTFTVVTALLITTFGTSQAVPVGRAPDSGVGSVVPSTAGAIAGATQQQVGKAIAAVGEEGSGSARTGLRVSTAAGSVSASSTAGTFRLSTPVPAGSTTTRVSTSETITSVSEHSFEVSSQSTADGGRLVVVMNNSSAPSKYTFDLNLPQGVSLKSQPDGSVRLVAAGGRAQVGQIDRPWAVDARGRHLKTVYRVAGSSVTQMVDTTGAAFPVVADPKLTYGWGVYLNLRGSEAQAVLTVFAAVGSAAVLYGCVSLRGPAQILSAIALVKSLCTIAGGGAVIKAIWLTLVIDANEYKAHPLQCYQKKIIPMASGGWVKVGSGNCS